MTPTSAVRPLSLFTLALVQLALLGPAARGQSPAWRYDYNAARREATEKNRPIVIDFVTENCFWCKKLDAGTFREPTIIALMNDRFVPLKIDVDRDPTLAAKLQIRSYPTLIIAANATGPPDDGRMAGSRW